MIKGNAQSVTMLEVYTYINFNCSQKVKEMIVTFSLHPTFQFLNDMKIKRRIPNLLLDYAVTRLHTTLYIYRYIYIYIYTHIYRYQECTLNPFIFFLILSGVYSYRKNTSYSKKITIPL